ncbi:MAG: type I restriction enzyme HsdR N-terminal domain-containing protein [Algoriphagus sp.]|uniref:type I restriction enzyme HsdR N-terminal domain-containing protein n=1 Tax=Algoriphagus sp. TaxID=1872435 RepID=UPI002623AD90|nr:type I restriction enzyme HsdR N-terminal domain-containing protein [Algoriphagus sp.]MDG1278915.1 type I restriction enzyme HsdR N-terminal domain-containing protein [Algoriphagus sp.]
MNMEKWNKLCYHLSEKIVGDISEREFEVLVDRALGILGWEEYSGDFEIRPSFQLGSTKNSLKPDFLIKSNSTGQKLFVVEIKRPKVPLSAQNQIQLSTYMRQFKLPFGILIGPEIQVFYDGSSNEQENAILIGRIKFEKDSKDGEEFVSLFSKDSFSHEALHGLAAEFLKKTKQKTKIEELVKRITSDDFQDPTKELIKQYLTQEYESEILDAVLNKVKIEIRSLDILPEVISSSKNEKSSSNFLKTRNPGEKDKTKIIINGNGVKLPKNRFVLEFIRLFNNKRQRTFSQLKNIFRDELQGSTGVINELEFVLQKYGHTDRKRHFVREDEILKSSDNIQFVVSTEWSIDNVQEIVKIAEKEGYKIDQVNG